VVSGNTRAGFAGNIDYVATATGSHIFTTTDSATERMRINSAGNVGIGTTAPAGNLVVSADNGPGTSVDLEIINRHTGGSSFFLSATDATDGWGANNFVIANAANATALMVVNQGGNVGIGSTAPTQRLDLGGGNISMGYEIITSANCTASTGGWAACTATCSAGKQALGGACGTGCCTRLAEYSSISYTSYTCGIYQSNAAVDFNATVVCANIK
jgi:hypothetical protein